MLVRRVISVERRRVISSKPLIRMCHQTCFIVTEAAMNHQISSIQIARQKRRKQSTQKAVVIKGSKWSRSKRKMAFWKTRLS